MIASCRTSDQSVDTGVNFSSIEREFAKKGQCTGTVVCFNAFAFVTCHEHYHKLPTPSQYSFSMPNAMMAMH